MIRVSLQRLSDGRVIVTVTVGPVLLLSRIVHLNEAEIVRLEVADE